MTAEPPEDEELPQPYEGINGTPRSSDDLLSLEEEAMPRRRAMIMMGLTMRTATLVGNAAPIVERLRERMMSPQPGDLVIETSRARRQDSEHHGIGILLAPPRREPGEADVWYVQYGPGERDIARWANCEFAAVPVERPWPVPACAHCGRDGTAASAIGVPLCHPDDPALPDCYRRVTVYHEPIGALLGDGPRPSGVESIRARRP